MMSNWKTKVHSKLRKQSQTSGSSKGPNCRATPIEKYMAKRNRSYKHPRYGEWLIVKSGIQKPHKQMSGW